MKSLMLLLAFGLATSEKLDRTYLPPPGSKYAGGTPGDLHVPLEYPKVTYTTTEPIKHRLYDHRTISAEDTQVVPGIQRIPGEIYQGPPVATPNRQFSYNVPTTTTSYAFTQTTTFPPIEGFETTISPLAQGFDLNGSVKPPSGIVNHLFDQNLNYPQSQISQGRPVIEPGQVTQFPGIILSGTNIPGSQTTISRGQTITGQPDYAQIQNQYQHNIPSSPILPATISQPEVQSHNQGYTQHLGVQPPRQLINQEYTATPTPFPQYLSNIPLYQNTSFFQQTNTGGYSQQLGQQSLQIQGTGPVSPFLQLQPGPQFVDKNGKIQQAVVPSTSIIQQSEKYQGHPFGIQDTIRLTSTPHNGNIFPSPGNFTPGGQLFQPGRENNLALSQRPHQSPSAPGIPESVITELQNQVPQYGLQQHGHPQIKGKSNVNSLAPFGASYPSSPGLISSQTPNQPYIGQQLPSSGTQQELVQLQGSQLPPQRGTYPTNAVTQRPIYGPVPPEQQYGDKKIMYPTNFSGGILNQQPQIIGQQRVPQDSSSYFPYGLAQEENKTDKIPGTTSPATNVFPERLANGLQQSPFVQTNRQPNLGKNVQPQFDQAGTKNPEQYTTPKPGSVGVHNVPGFTEYTTPIYNQKSTPNSTPVPMPHSTTQEYITRSSTYDYANSQGNVPSKLFPRPVRPQTEVDRNAEILNYQNILTPTGYSYNFDTLNGIHADENGTTIDGTRAKGSYSYFGDDGKVYKIEYTADENGFLPRGDHIPTPPPVPESIQRVIEQAERDRAAGISHDGFYDHSRYGPKRYQKHKTRPYPQSQKNEDRTTINDMNLPNSDFRSTGDAKKYRTQPGRKPLTEYNDGSLDDIFNDENDKDIMTDSITSKPYAIKFPGRKSGDITNDEEKNTKAYHNQSSNKFEPGATRPTNGVVTSRRPTETIDKFEKQVNKYKHRPEDDDYDFLNDDDFEPILGNSKNKGPLTSKNKDFKIRKYYPSSLTYKKPGVTQSQDDRQPGTTSKYEESMIPEEQFVDDEEDRQQNLTTKPYVPTKAQKKKNQVTTAKYEEDFDNQKEPAYIENTQTNRQPIDYSRRPQGMKPTSIRPNIHLSKKLQSSRRPSVTRYDVDDQDTIYQSQGTQRPSSMVIDDGKDYMEEIADQYVQQQKPSNVLPQRPQISKKPTMIGSFEEGVEDQEYSNYQQNNQQGKPEQNLFKKIGIKYHVTDHTDKYNKDLESPEDNVSDVRGRPYNPTSTRQPGYETIHYKQEEIQRPGSVGQGGDIQDIDVSIVEMGKPTYKQADRDDETGYQYTRPINPYKQIDNKFPTRFSDTHSTTRKSFTKYDDRNTKTTAKPFTTSNVSRNDDDVNDNSFGENLPLKQTGKPATRKFTTPSYEDYQTTETIQENIKDENMFTPGTGTKQLSEFDREYESETSSTTSRPFDINETIGDYTQDTASTTPSTFGTSRPSRPGNYTRVTEPSTDSTTGPSNILSSMATSQTVYDYPDRTFLPGTPNIRPGLLESAFSEPSPSTPKETGRYSTNIPGSNNAGDKINQTGNPPEVSGPFTPLGDINLNSGQITAIPSRFPGQTALQDLPSTTYRPNFYGNDITRPSQVNFDIFGRPVSESVTSNQNVPFTQGKYTRPIIPDSIVNVGESRFGVTTSAPGPKPAEFGPSSITTPGYLGPEIPRNKIIGEDFSGPKQPQRFDTNTGYYY